MVGRRTARWGLLFLAVGIGAGGAASPAGAQEPLWRPPVRYSNQARQRAWLRQAHQSVEKDVERITELARELRNAEALAPALHERLQKLEVRAQELRAMVAAANEHLLSLYAVRRAEEIKSEARALRQALDGAEPRQSSRKLRQLAREMEKRADSVADRIRWP